MAGEDNRAEDEAGEEPASGEPAPGSEEPASAGDELDLESQLDDLAASLKFDLDDEFDEPLSEDDIAQSQEIADDAFAVTSLATDAEPAEEPAPDESGDALELDDVDVEEIVEPSEARSLYLVVDGTVARVDRDRFVIGRVTKLCDLAIVDVNISRQHCAIERRGDRFFVVDLGSINGVLLDGTKIDDHCIAEGDELVLSGHTIHATFTPPVEAVPTHAFAEPEIPPFKTGEYEPVPAEQGFAEAFDEEEPQPSAAAPSFEQRVELRLEQLAHQVAYLQEAMQQLMTQMQHLQGLIPLSQMIQQRMAAKRR